MLKLILIGLVVVIAAILIYAATKPDTFRVQRSILVKAPASKIFPLINDLHIMQTWSPWESDPAMQRSYSGAASGSGAVYEWRSEDQHIGQGRMQITESSPSSKVALRMDFIQPFKAVNTVEFMLDAESGATRVTQAIFGPSPFLMNLMTLCFNRDKMVGDKFEQGLAGLKALAER